MAAATRSLLTVLILLLLTPVAAPIRAADTLTLQLRWTPQAQFMGYYVADTLGLYAAEGLVIDIQPGGSGHSPWEALRDGDADVAVEWLGAALSAREAMFPAVNVAQIFQRSSMMLICHRDHGITEAADLRDKTLSVWPGSSEDAVARWIDNLERELGRTMSSVSLVPQEAVLESWGDPGIDCVSATSYNEYWELLDNGLTLAETTLFRFEDLNRGVLEDGLYVDQRRLFDPAFVDRLTRFTRASLAGWAYAATRPVEAVEILVQRFPHLDRSQQLRMAKEIIPLLDRERSPLGRLDVETLDNNVELLGYQENNRWTLDRERNKAWTHAVWRMLDEQEHSPLSDEVLYRLEQVLAGNAFYLLDLIGTLAFGIAGFARAVERRYDLWGALILTALPAVGGGTLRDIIVGGDRHPPFVFTDPTYIYIVLGIVFVGSILNVIRREETSLAVRFSGLLLIIDTIGLAAFCIIGAKVALLAGLDWFWIPCLAAITCAGGGIMLDIVTGREPRTFRGVIYEEIAIIGGLFLMAMLYLADYAGNVERFIEVSIVLTFLLVFTTRIVIVRKNWQAPRLIYRSVAEDP